MDKIRIKNLFKNRKNHQVKPVSEIDILVIESFSFTPHLETAGEIAVRQARLGKKTAFSYIDANNPDDALPFKNILFGASKRRKFEEISKILSKHNIDIIKLIPLPESIINDIKSFTLIQPQNVEELKTLTYKDARLGLGIASSLISHTKEPYPDLNLHRSLLKQYMKASAFTYEYAYQLIKRYKPTKIVVFNGRFACAKSIVEAGLQLGVSILFHERGADYRRFSIHPQQCHDFAYVRKFIRESWQQGDQNREIVARNFFERKKQGDGISWKSFTDAQNMGYVPKRKLPRRLVYFSSSDDEFTSIGELIQQPLFPSQREAVNFLIRWVSFKTDTELIIRVHPHLREKAKTERDWWNNLSGSNLLTIPADSAVDSYALADSADIVLSYGSTMGVESAYLGKPSILMGDSDYRGLGCSYEPGSVSELIQLIENKNLPSLPSENALPYGFYAMTMGELYNFYEPTSLFDGSFMGVKLSYERQWVRGLKRTQLFKWIKNRV